MWSNWKIYQPELCKSQWTGNGTIGETVESLQHGWNSKQMRNNPTLWGSEHQYTWKNLQGMVFGHWIRETKDFFRIPLAQEDEFNN